MQCCVGAFAINQLDVARLRHGLAELASGDPERAENIRQRCDDAVRRLAPDFPGDAASGILDESEDSARRFASFANDKPCPVLDPGTGRCELYEARPVTCRVFGPPVRMGDGNALGHCELCFVGASKEVVAACEMAVPNALEAGLVDEIGVGRETVVAYALLRES